MFEHLDYHNAAINRQAHKQVHRLAQTAFWSFGLHMLYNRAIQICDRGSHAAQKQPLTGPACDPTRNAEKVYLYMNII